MRSCVHRNSKLLHVTCRFDYDPHSLEIPLGHFNTPMDKPQSLNRKFENHFKMPRHHYEISSGRTGRVTTPWIINDATSMFSWAFRCAISLQLIGGAPVHTSTCFGVQKMPGRKKHHNCHGNNLKKKQSLSTPIAQVLYSFHLGWFY